MLKANLMGTVVLSAMLTACGGSSGSSTPASTPAPVAPTPTTPAPTVYKGVFFDSAVSNLSYTTDTHSGRTTSDGEFDYGLDEDVVFSIGSIQLPAVKAAAVLTPLEIYSTTDIYHQSLVNVIRLLQSLDADANPENGIEISESVHDLAANMSLDFNAADFEQTANDFVASTNGINTQLISANQAIEHFQRTLENLDISVCGKSHPMVGYSGDFNTFSHNVAGRATIVDDCTIQVSSFSYDGGGPDVYFYGAINHAYESQDAFIIGSQINGQEYNNAEITLRLPSGMTLDDLNTMSVWCVDFNVDFGSLTFTP